MNNSDLAIVILAAGKGTRMKSKLHKVLHPIAGHPMLHHLMDTAAPLNPARKIIVVGAGKEQIEQA
ncbi:MAG: NTP transferase domain-containing protein, partial [Kordiimonadaceae bacterium]|nr:NTP transferase domain-containing protein [Kordiimonadaceae bacterium]